MDQLTLTVFTIAANAVIISIAVFFFQKRVENSLSKKLFEHQVKFSQIHTKRVEALEGVYQKYVTFAAATEKVLNMMLEAEMQGTEISHKQGVVNRDRLSEAFNDFSSYFKANRLFLPDSSIDEIWDITQMSQILQYIIGTRPPPFADLSNIAEDWRFGFLDILGIEDPTNKARDPKVLVQMISGQVEKFANRLEKMYKSVADIS